MSGCLCSIVPPNVLEQVARTGSPADRESALNTLAIDHSLRTLRIENGTLRGLAARRLALAHGGGGAPLRVIYDAQHRTDTHASRVMRTEGEAPVGDTAANEAFDGLGHTYRLYWDAFQRDSIDDGGMPLLGEVHFGVDYDNAFWDGARMMFGDGDGRLFTGFTAAIDVIGHELTHGVTQDTLGLRYIGQSGALNESISDVFGSLVKQFALNQTAEQADWLIGEGILGPALQGVALRSMKAPGTAFEGDVQPAHMSGYVRTASDNGGVHINSGIPNHAFYLAAAAIGGQAWAGAGRIWYDTMSSGAVRPDAQFHAFAMATLHTAERLFGLGSSQAVAVSEAWTAVGVLKGVRALDAALG
ncbi:MAG TPA: M4 family metallopeptidase [Candidatus Dormibacteraeota bacterium]